MTDVSLPALVARVVVSLAVVLAVMAVAAAVLRRSGVGGVPGRARRGSARIEVLARHGVGRNSAVAVVRLGERGLVLGVTETQVTLLTEVDPDEIIDPPEAPGTVPPGGGSSLSEAWKATLDLLRERTVRRS